MAVKKTETKTKKAASAEPAKKAEEPKAESAPRTLNDILRERSAQTTLGDSYLDQKSEESPAQEDTAVVVPPVVSTPEAPTPAGGDNGDNGGHDDYNDNVIDDYEAEIARHKRTSNGFMLCAIIAIVLLIPAAYFSISLGMQKKTIEDNLEIVESARRIFEDENSMLQRNAEDLVTELEGLKDQNDTMMLKYQEAVTMLEQLQKELGLTPAPPQVPLPPMDGIDDFPF